MQKLSVLVSALLAAAAANAAAAPVYSCHVEQEIGGSKTVAETTIEQKDGTLSAHEVVVFDLGTEKMRSATAFAATEIHPETTPVGQMPPNLVAALKPVLGTDARVAAVKAMTCYELRAGTPETEPGLDHSLYSAGYCSFSDAAGAKLADAVFNVAALLGSGNEPLFLPCAALQGL